MLTLVKLKMQM